MKQAFHFKGGNYTISAISINVTEFTQIESLLSSKVAQSKSFFQNTPFVIDVSEIDRDEKCTVEFLDKVISCFRYNGMIPVGFVVNNQDLKTKLAKAGHNILKNGKVKENTFEEIPRTSAKIITSPVRTGQSINARDADVIVTANVNNGAEIIADGSVIVYGRIGGRVLAGSSGNKEAKIICKDLKAELVSIAGKYVTLNNESIPINEKSTDGYIVYLKDDKIHIESF
ncbi:septum site-determining protein MinC [Allofrancisella guangzhouensis]|uniref:Probable septum site-determining protein MinC n=1 Tax=Allofrancisella guangzhouensis TaxID=594679 RepID=A0A0A8E2P2_9GAMM|nr:septum site-determining protein MinC [Allofrancisella guangzhouensis]AJC48263.1 septum site-determining protein MinC [Allofrancisella guangzhouensis]MBK2027509.1 septum site-determining protein MinC [Allofrancisella guangzhouensis]MBK2044382.1 septum site-determining protein MinC [Allofrancisella guangzhouensis]MBK2045432.1 septum site-determining protein MinC [Allofrancisella guangzhouensis]